MTKLRTPADAATAVLQNPTLPAGDDERFVGFGVMGFPFRCGHYLGLRYFPATTFSPGYRSVWHRDPAGVWTFYATTPGQQSCAKILQLGDAECRRAMRHRRRMDQSVVPARRHRGTPRRLSDRLGLDRLQRNCIYYATLIMWIGCHADSHEYARWFGDDIAVRHDAYMVDWSGLPYMRFLINNLARGEPLPHRLNVMATLFINARGRIGDPAQRPTPTVHNRHPDPGHRQTKTGRHHAARSPPP